MFITYSYIASKNLHLITSYSFFFMLIFWVIVLGTIIIVLCMVGNLLQYHTKLILKESGTIDDMGNRD